MVLCPGVYCEYVLDAGRRAMSLTGKNTCRRLNPTPKRSAKANYRHKHAKICMTMWRAREPEDKVCAWASTWVFVWVCVSVCKAWTQFELTLLETKEKLNAEKALSATQMHYWNKQHLFIWCPLKLCRLTSANKYPTQLRSFIAGTHAAKFKNEKNSKDKQSWIPRPGNMHVTQ